jgi:putrescine transport system substrate-binding protein
MNRSLVLALGALLVAAPAVAQEEKVLNVYNWSDYIAADTVANFEAETGIKVNYDVFDSNELVESKLLAGNSGYDVVVPSGFFFARQAKAGLFRELDKSKLPNLVNMDPDVMAATAAYDPGNTYAVDYMWGTTGIGYNAAKIAERMADAPTDSWDMIFNPEIVAKFADCGVTILDAPAEVMATALNYLGLDPNSESPDDLEKGKALLTSIKPYVRYFHSSQYIDDLANGEVCLSIGYSGDVFIAADNAAEGTEIAYTIPKEGALRWFDLLGIPVDAPHPDNAHQFINYLMDAKVAAAITDTVHYASGNKAALEFVSDEVKDDPRIYPSADIKLFPLNGHAPDYDELLTRAWTFIKTGQ